VNRAHLSRNQEERLLQRIGTGRQQGVQDLCRLLAAAISPEAPRSADDYDELSADAGDLSADEITQGRTVGSKSPTTLARLTQYHLARLLLRTFPKARGQLDLRHAHDAHDRGNSRSVSFAGSVTVGCGGHLINIGGGVWPLDESDLKSIGL
jgi:hypothetical protein